MKTMSNRKGIALFVTLIVSVAMGVLVTSTMVLTSTDTLIGKNYKDVFGAFGVAEAGAYKALDLINSSAGTYGAMLTGSTVTVVNSESMGNGKCTVVAEAIGQDSIGKPILRLKSTGSLARSSSTVSLFLQPDYDTKYKFGAFAKDRMTFSGNFSSVDSYDSTIGTYGGVNIGLDGDIGTNSISAGALDIGNGDIFGDAVAGAGGNPSTVIYTGPSATLTGVPFALKSPLSLPAVSITSFSGPDYNITSGTLTLGPGNYGNLRITGGGEVILDAGASDPGKFYFNDININSSKGLKTVGNIEIYVLQDCKAGGNGILNTTQDTTKLKIFVQKYDPDGDGEADNEIDIEGNGLFYGTIYAPDVDVDINGNGSLYGSIIGKDVDFTGQAKLHFDTKLKYGNGVVNKFIITSWKEN